MRDTALTLLAWTAVIAVQLWQRALLPAALILLDELRVPPAPVRVPPPAAVPISRDPQQLQQLSCRQLRALAGVRRHLPKRQLIELLQAA